MVSPLASSEARGAERAIRYSRFFRLPIELREMIYIHLFERGRVHVWYFGSEQSKAYRQGWWHTICHRPTYYGNDRCRTHPTAADRSCLTPEQSQTARLRVFGWLLCCRRAYSESIQFLYSSNTFSVEPNYFPSFSDMERLFPPNCLSSVKSLELLYPVATYRDIPILDRFTSTIALIPSIFPHLRTFHIAISSWWMLCALEHWEHFTANHTALVRSELLGTLDGLVRRFDGRLKECEVTVDPNYYEIVKLLEDENGSGRPVEIPVMNWTKELLGRKYWRPIEGKSDVRNTRLGYWIIMAC
ncbi:hypothetical protein D8B26_005440 [Coccidioides posadasii str. Silveira]|uniref:DUF7730 domain-containing protein n=2 Tax=Coccidioides posadasii TaxID=199306 RepID=E9DJ34_COCPS|nr:conserved hypothetical protein [Coccidioides posadasii str. Silveira]KMM66015.1 hypothetical protein CPAG_02356 [Coccidioides posadasii RMSCC 3488]QVM10787.1 hypothetical protein D8B26_005440 [Coccidioides posadasii str. Silveira]